MTLPPRLSRSQSRLSGFQRTFVVLSSALSGRRLRPTSIGSRCCLELRRLTSLLRRPTPDPYRLKRLSKVSPAI